MYIAKNPGVIEEKWEELKALFAKYLGDDASKDVIDLIEEGIDENEGDDEADAIALGLSGIAGKYGILKCKEAADAMADYLKKQKQEFKFITMY